MCAGSCGPGNLHLINGLFDADRSRAPVLAIVECSVYCGLVSVPEQLPRIVADQLPLVASTFGHSGSSRTS